jgi:DnaK suppressor protein
MTKREDRFEGVRRKLIGMRQDLIRETKAELLCVLNPEDRQNGASDDGDWADLAVRDLTQAAQSARHQSQLKAIEGALGRIEEGTYGICEDCEEEIPLGRLNVMPFAFRCVECQAVHEIETGNDPSPF